MKNENDNEWIVARANNALYTLPARDEMRMARERKKRQGRGRWDNVRIELVKIARIKQFNR